MLGVLPEYRRRGAGRILVETALESLKERGMEAAEAWTQEDKPTCKNLYESLGFELVRVSSTMRRTLENIPSGIGESEDVKLRNVNTEDSEDVKLFRELDNEAFKEHFNYRPKTLEEVEYEFRERPWCDIAEYYFALMKDAVVGFTGVGIDSRFIKHNKINRGYIMTIGVLKPFRRQGIGTSLMLHGLKTLKSKGMKEAELGVDDSNPTKAIELYRKVGFKTSIKDLTYRKKV